MVFFKDLYRDISKLKQSEFNIYFWGLSSSCSTNCRAIIIAQFLIYTSLTENPQEKKDIF